MERFRDYFTENLTHNPESNWFCAKCGAPLKTKSEKPSFYSSSTSLPSKNKPIEKQQYKINTIQHTDFVFLASYAKILEIFANVIFVIAFIGAIVGVWLWFRAGWSGFLVLLSSLISGFVAYYNLKVTAEIAKALTQLDIYTRQTLEYLKVNNQLLTDLNKKENTENN